MNEDCARIPRELVREYGTRDPFKIAGLLDISVKYINTRRQKGFCRIIDGCPFIFINRNMSEQMRKMTCAHELGHLLLHEEILTERSFLMEYELFDIQNRTEYEANAFAANLLIDSADLSELLGEEADIITAASALDVNVNLLMIRMIEEGTDGSRSLPFLPDRKFLGKIRDDAGSF
ncbi:MAG: ImmA/IrrE family metallo-endopeptidase [Solobacterium sp.]|nr:ImmA/IrrE family metallo-endopeptidase [Solobacterium sp.]